MNNSNPWDDHPNAVHIDRVIDSALKNPELWKKVGEYLASGEFLNDIVRNEYLIAWNLAIAASDKRGGLHKYIRRNQPEVDEAAVEVIMGLLAWDDCAYMLDSDPGELELLATFGNNAANILLPAAMVFSKEIQTTTI